MALSEATKIYRKENQLCPKCGQPNEPNKSMCRKHLDQECVRSSRNQKRRRLVRKEVGLCTVCGDKAIDGKRLCEKHRQYKNEKRKIQLKQWRDNKLCLDCGAKREEGYSFCLKCLERKRIRQQNFRLQRNDLGICTECGKNPTENGVFRCRECLDKHNDWYATSDYRDKHAELRAIERDHVFAYYGNECICCGENEKNFLTIDHIEGDGNKHRREIGKAGSGFYKWLIVNDFPSGFQLLCCNCNAGRYRNKGICPHQEKK